METVARNVKYHLSQDKTSQSTATNVSQITDHKTEEVQVAEDLVEEATLAEDLAVEVEAEEALTEDHEKCTKQLVETVARNVKYHLSQKLTNQSTVTNVFKTIKETSEYTRVMDKINPIRTYYVATIVLVIATIVFFILDF